MTTTEFPSTSDASTWSVRFARTDAAFEVAVERDYDVDGFPFTSEYTHLPYGAQVDVRFERAGEASTYAEARQAVLDLVEAVAHTSLIVQFNAGRKDGWSFIATGWMPLDEASELLVF